MLQSVATKLRILSWTIRPIVNLRWYSDDEKSEKVEKKEKSKNEKPKERVIKSKEASNRLNSLLESMSARNVKAEGKIPAPPQKRKEKPEPKTRQEKLEAVTEAIATKIGGDVKQTQAELLSKLLGSEIKHSGSLSDLISGMKVEQEVTPKKPKFIRQEESKTYSRAENVRQSMQNGKVRMPIRRSPAAPSTGVVDLFGAEPLGIFDKASTSKDILDTWSMLEKREMKLAVTHPPKNYFEKMMQWTDEGKLWQFPINNEQGMEEEHEVDFSEHVLLEMHLEEWCPTSGPVRHFMELVCVGLSKNYFLSAKEKQDHILWYRDYFEQKKDLLGDLMLMGKSDAPQLAV